MKKISLLAVAASAVVALTSGCVVAPPRHAQAAVYVAPAYASPGPGWNWEFHARYGWGWHHPHRGWHRGWY
jgi:hypothetical protein